MRKENGITLIALVITIIVLLILAGITIAMLSGPNGILTKASDSSVENALGSAKDKVAVLAADAVADYYKEVYVTGAQGAGNQRPYSSDTLDTKVVAAIDTSKLGVDGVTVGWNSKTITLTYTKTGQYVTATLDAGAITGWSTTTAPAANNNG